MLAYLVGCDIQVFAFHSGLDSGPSTGGLMLTIYNQTLLLTMVRIMTIGARTVVGLI